MKISYGKSPFWLKRELLEEFSRFEYIVQIKADHEKTTYSNQKANQS